MVDKNKMYDIIFWISMTTMVVWVILKIAGVINSPPLLESLPTISTIFAAGVFYQKFSTFDHRLAIVERKLDNLEGQFHHLDKRVVLLEAKPY